MIGQTQNKTLTKPSAKRELREWLQGEQFRRELAALLPKTMSPDRFVRIAFQAIHRNPELVKCTQESFFNCLLQLGAMGLEPDGRRAHLIPFKDECTLIVDYKGIKELVRRNHDVSVMHGDVVGANDEFEVRYGTHGILDHKPNLEDRGRIICAYSWVKLPDGNEEYDVMNFAEIEAIRRRSRSPNKGPWVTDWNEMAKKSVFRRHSKGLPLSPETRDALERDSDADALTEQERFASAAPAIASVSGRQRSLRTPVGEREAEPDDGAEPEPAPAVPEAAVSAAIPASGEPAAQASLGHQVLKRLAQAGYTQEELLALMKGLKLAPRTATSVEDVADQHLEMVLEDWDTCADRLAQQRAEEPQNLDRGL